MGLSEAVKHSFKREAKIVEDDTCALRKWTTKLEEHAFERI